MSAPYPRRHGFGLIILVVALGIVSLVLGSITVQIAVSRKAAARREEQVQAHWLARAGLEIAAARLLAAPDAYRGESVEVVPGSVVRIEVRRDRDTILVTSEATSPSDSTQPVVRAATRTYRPAGSGTARRLEVVAPPGRDAGPGP